MLIASNLNGSANDRRTLIGGLTNDSALISKCKSHKNGRPWRTPCIGKRSDDAAGVSTEHSAFKSTSTIRSADELDEASSVRRRRLDGGRDIFD